VETEDGRGAGRRISPKQCLSRAGRKREHVRDQTRSPAPWRPQDAIMPNRDITAPAPGEAERASSEIRRDEHHADRIMQDSLAGPGREFFHVLRAHVGCDGKKAGLTPCLAIWVPKSEPHLPRTGRGQELVLAIKRSGARKTGGAQGANQTAGANRTASSQKAPKQKHQLDGRFMR
jgi:hypothetical protein